MESGTRDRIQQLVESNQVFLFMKGHRGGPQCGFSAQIVQILDRVLPSYETFDVLSDMEVREGIKEFSDWPTIPQLYIGGEFQGGCDIVREMYEAGELHEALGLEQPSVLEPKITVTEAAMEVLERAKTQSGGGDLHIGVDSLFRHSLGFGPAMSSAEVVREIGDLTVRLDRDSAARADGLVLDAQQMPDGTMAINCSNPNAPVAVRQMPVEQLQQLRSIDQEMRLIDVRTVEEREIASIDGSVLLDESVARELTELERDTMLVFYCHSGQRSQQAAEQFASMGFTNVHNLAGGIDAWSVGVDADVPRY